LEVAARLLLLLHWALGQLGEAALQGVGAAWVLLLLAEAAALALATPQAALLLACQRVQR
jgi:hypothetical protein